MDQRRRRAHEMKLLFQWLFVARLKVAREGLPTPKKGTESSEHFLLPSRAATGDACWCFQCCLRTCPGGWGDGWVRVRRRQPRVTHGGSDALGAAACQNAERRAQEPTRLCSHIHMLIYSDNELWGRHSKPAYSHQRVFLK